MEWIFGVISIGIDGMVFIGGWVRCVNFSVFIVFATFSHKMTIFPLHVTEENVKKQILAQEKLNFLDYLMICMLQLLMENPSHKLYMITLKSST